MRTELKAQQKNFISKYFLPNANDSLINSEVDKIPKKKFIRDSTGRFKANKIIYPFWYRFITSCQSKPSPLHIKTKILYCSTKITLKITRNKRSKKMYFIWFWCILFLFSGFARNECRPFVVAGQQVGLVRADVFQQLLCYPEIFLIKEFNQGHRIEVSLIL